MNYLENNFSFVVVGIKLKTHFMLNIIFKNQQLNRWDFRAF